MCIFACVIFLYRPLRFKRYLCRWELRCIHHFFVYNKKHVSESMCLLVTVIWNHNLYWWPFSNKDLLFIYWNKNIHAVIIWSYRSMFAHSLHCVWLLKPSWFTLYMVYRRGSLSSRYPGRMSFWLGCMRLNWSMLCCFWTFSLSNLKMVYLATFEPDYCQNIKMYQPLSYLGDGYLISFT